MFVPRAAAGDGGVWLDLVVDADEVVAELLDRIRGIAGLHSLGIVGNQKRLLGLADNDALFALQNKSISSCSARERTEAGCGVWRTCLR